MKKVFSILFCWLFSSLIPTQLNRVCACAGGDYDETVVAFAPEIADIDSSFHPLFCAQTLFYKQELSTINLFNASIVKDWSEYLQGNVTPADISYLLLNDSAAALIKTIDSVGEHGQLPLEWQSRLNMHEPVVRNFLRFLVLAKAIEPYTTVVRDTWSYDPKSDTLRPVEKHLIDQVQAAYAAEHDAFIKNRYWLLAIKALFYSTSKNASNSEAQEFFAATEKAQPKNTAYYRALSYIAGLYYTQRDYLHSNLYYARVFAHCPELRFVAALQFHPLSDEIFEQQLQQCTEVDDKLAMWTLFGYYGNDERAMREMAKIVPSSPYLDLLLTRAINTRESTSFFDKKTYSSYRETLRKNFDTPLLSFVDSTAERCHKRLWILGAAYLNALAAKEARADTLFEQYRKVGSLTTLESENLQVLLTVHQVLNKTSNLQSFESLFMRHYTFRTPWDEHNALQRQTRWPSDWIKRIVALMYHEKGNHAYAQMFVPERYYFQLKSNRDEFRKTFGGSTQSEYLKFLGQMSSQNIDHLNMYEAELAFYAGNPVEAMRIMRMSPLKDSTVSGDPFQNNIQDNHDSDHQSYKGPRRSKMQIVERALSCLNELADTSKKFKAALCLGNIYYNISYFGNARLFYEDALIDDSFFDEDAMRNNHYKDKDMDMVFNNQLASKYYQLALSAAKNDEQRAQATFLIAKCERNQYYCSSKYNEHKDFLGWKSYLDLKQKYSKTKYYSEAIKECGYLRSYAKRAR